MGGEKNAGGKKRLNNDTSNQVSTMTWSSMPTLYVPADGPMPQIQCADVCAGLARHGWQSRGFFW